MAWSVIRKATAEDVAAVKAARAAFVARYNVEPMEIHMADATPNQRHGMRRSWKALVGKALGNRDADGISFGTVGYNVK